MIDYEDLTPEQESELVNNLKKQLRDIVLKEDSYIVVYALLELAAEFAMGPGRVTPSFFIEAAQEVDTIFNDNPERFLDY